MRTLQSAIALVLLGLLHPAWGQSDGADQPIVEEIVVTARKRGEEYLSNVAMSISAIGGDELLRRNLQRMDDYLRTEPGTNFVDRGTARNSVIIRGITVDPGRGGTITGIYIDETPVQGLGFAGTGSPDLGLVDIERVEVLRGPQGTLYGAGSMSGTVRTITRAPDLDALGGTLRLGGSNTSGSGDWNSDIEGVLNLPIVKDRFGLRAVAYRIDTSGYIRNVAADDPAKQAGVQLLGARLSDNVGDRGALEVNGYRLGALWQVQDNFSIRATAMGQDSDQDGVPTIDVLQGSYEQSRYARLDGTDEGLEDDLDLMSLVVDYAAKNWSLVSASAWNEYESSIDYDVGIFFLDSSGGVEPPIFLRQEFEEEVFTQELRWTWDDGGRWHALLGGFYEDRKSGFIQGDAFEGTGGGGSTNRFSSSTEQTSFFGDVTHAVSDTWEISVGARFYDVDSSDDEGNTQNETDSTWKLGVHWRPEYQWLGDEPLVYFTWAEGFRPGYPVGTPPPQCDQDGDGVIEGVGLPFLNIESENLESLELGYKAAFANGRIAVSAALFYIEWDDLQLQLAVPPPCAFSLPFNASAAQSQGVEFGLNAMLTDNLQLDVSASVVEAELTQDAPSIGNSGDRLPGTPEYNATFALDYVFPLANNEAWARTDIAWVSDFSNNFQGAPPELGDYTTVNVSAGIEIGAWNLELYVINLTDSDAATWANPIWTPYDRESRLRPRTIGARVEVGFGNN